jgi:large subunit ribosomal protein L17
MRNLAISMLMRESIRTTLPKAKELRPFVEKLITLGKKGTLHARRTAFKVLRDEGVLKRLFDEIAPRMKERPGGYTRILRFGFRASDAAQMAVIELVERSESVTSKPEGESEKESGKSGT